MAPIKFTRVVSYSSEDPIHKADNLLNPQSTKKWKCKNMGEKQASAILQLTKQVQINAVDIGNEYSAFVEVYAAKSSNPDDYKVLLPAVCMMSIQDSKQGVGINSVRFFKAESLLHADETWDRIKLVCTQPYNKCVQYGLAFVTVHSTTVDKTDDAPPPSTSTQSTSSQKLGNFVLKEESTESSSISLGNWFSKRKSISPPKEYTKVPKTSLASSIKDDASAHLVKAEKPKKAKKNDDLSGKTSVEVKAKNGDARRAARGPLLYVPDEDDSNDDQDVKTNDSKNKDVKISNSQKKRDNKGQEKKKDSKESDKKKDSRESEKKKDSKDSSSQRIKDPKNGNDSSKKQQTNKTPSNSAPSPNYQTKPFDRLLEGVTFVISGFENPLRSDLRNQALEMGAFYKANWDQTCTHLICAFPNTPKCRSVQSLNGKIVTKDWVGDCYNQCKRLPWRRYALLRGDQGQSESEEEIHEERKKTSGSKLLDEPSTSHDVPHSTSGASLSQATPSSASPSTSTQPSYPSDDDTDIDDGPEFSAKLTTRQFSNIFKDLSFLVHASISESLQEKLFRYITSYAGYCSCEGKRKYSPIPKPNEDNHIDYIVAESLNNDEMLKYTKSKWIRSDWIWDCINEEKLVPSDAFIISGVKHEAH